MGKYTILASSSSLLLLMFLFPPAYADDLNPPDFRGEPNSLHFVWNTIEQGQNPPDVFTQGPSPFPLSNFAFNPITPPASLNFIPDGFVVLNAHNFVDNFKKKFIRVQVTHSGSIVSSDMFWFKFNQDTGDLIAGNDNCLLLGERVVIDANHFYEDWRCLPNPDAEQYVLIIGPPGDVRQLVMDTISPFAVGGTVLLPDTVSLLVLETQNSLVWWLPAVVIAGAGLALFKIKKKN